MKILLLTVLLSLPAFGAKPLDIPALSEETSKMQVLKGYFDAGTLATADDLLGFWSGRNYHLGYENDPTGIRLSCFWNEPGNHGPLFPDGFFGCVHSGIKKGYGEPDKFDSGITQDVVDYTREKSRLSSVSFSESEGTCFDNHEQGFIEAYQGRECYRMYQGNIIRVLHRNGQITEAGYFFKVLEIVD